MSQRKRLKLPNNSALNFIPVAYRFHQITPDDMGGFDPSDDGVNANEMFEEAEYDYLILQVLYNLNDKQKIVFLYQMLRDYGHRIDHESFAKTIQMERSTYMNFLKKVRIKSGQIIKQETNNSK